MMISVSSRRLAGLIARNLIAVIAVTAIFGLRAIEIDAASSTTPTLIQSH